MSNGKNAYLMEERSSNSPRLVENLRFSREAFIKLCLQEHIPMPKQWQALANDMAEKERERRFPNRCSVQEACVLMAGDELDTAEKYDTGDIRFTAEQNALYENLTKKIQKKRIFHILLMVRYGKIREMFMSHMKRFLAGKRIGNGSKKIQWALMILLGLMDCRSIMKKMKSISVD